MSKISISELNPAGLELLEGSDSLANQVRELSEAELQISGGGHYYGGGRGGSSSSGGFKRGGGSSSSGGRGGKKYGRKHRKGYRCHYGYGGYGYGGGSSS